MALIYCDGDSELAKGVAKNAAEAIVSAYPNHSWTVECRGGCLIVKHADASGLRQKIGMVRHMASLDHDAGVMKKEVVRAAGELLERAGLARGANDGSLVKRLDGLDKNMRKHWNAPLVPSKVIH